MAMGQAHGADATAAAVSPPAGKADAPAALTGFNVRSFSIEGTIPPATNLLAPIFSRHAGTNIAPDELVRVAAEVQTVYRDHGHPDLSVVIGTQHAGDGVVTLNVFHGALPQIVLAGRRYVISPEGEVTAANPAPAEPAGSPASPATASATATNSGPAFEVRKYLVEGNTLLSSAEIARAITNAPAAFGTNVTLGGIQAALSELQQAYRVRGYVTASVGLPQQKLTNASVRLQVTEGRLATINVRGNHYFSSNNVMRALPSLHTNMILNGLVFQSELNRANANQDRQIYPVIGPGFDPGTSELTLNVKDHLPLHGKLELNNQSTPGTPDLRVNASAAYNNLWQHEHSLGVQYSFSPEAWKAGDQWNTYDLPLVANYSAFYRLPLFNPEAVADVIASNPGSFGYNEGERRFVLPPPSGQMDLTVYASRATIDTGVQNLSSATLLDIPGVRRITRNDSQQDLTVNESLGFRLNQPARGTETFSSSFSEGLDFKSYALNSGKTNSFVLSEITYDANGNQNPPVVSTVNSPVPETRQSLDYLPVSLAYNAQWRVPRATLGFGLGLSANTSFSGSTSNLQNIAGSTKASGHWVTLDPNFSADIVVRTNWVLSLRANGRWASEPLISNEQFGAGGIASVRGYHEGEVFGDTGWHVSLEQKTPPHVVGMVAGQLPLTVRGSVYMDYAETYLLDPQGRDGRTALWGVGFGTVASLGSYWEARFLFSLPLLDAGTINAHEPFFNFALTAQF